MKVVILAGGLGTRLAEETSVVPKPMVEVGGRPLLWHIMKSYARWGFDEFIVALGYKGEVIKRFFLDFRALEAGLTVNLGSGIVEHHGQPEHRWRVHLVETGRETNTGGRLMRLRSWLGDEPFMLTYGDGVADIDLRALVGFHRGHGRIATVTAVRPPARFGGLDFLPTGEVTAFVEKPQTGEGWINGGFMVLEPTILDLLHSDGQSLEIDALEPLASRRQLMAYRHETFWQCVDTLRDKRYLEHLWDSGKAPWRTW